MVQPSEPGDDSNDEPTGSKDDPTSGFLLNRRRYLGAAGAAAAAFAGVGTATTNAESQEYDTITVGTNNLKRIRISSGETFENKLIDITASGASVQIIARSTGWTIRNIGVKGPQSHDEIMFVVSDPDSSSESLFENVYLGDGKVHSQAFSAGVWCDATGSDAHRGHITFRNVNVQEFGDGLYCSGPAAQQGSDAGSVTIESCYGKNNNVAQFRVAQNGSVVRDSVAEAHKGEVPPNPSGATNGRGIRAVDGDGSECYVKNCDVRTDPWNALQARQGSAMFAKDCRTDGPTDGHVRTQNVTDNPDLTPPEGVPMTPVQAASGENSSSLDRTHLVLSNDTPGESTRYDIKLGDGEFVRTNMLNPDDELLEGRTRLQGWIFDSQDELWYSGCVSTVDFEGVEPVIYRDGEQVAPEELIECPSEDSSNVITISGRTDGGAAPYEFTVSGDLEKSTANSASINSDDTVEGSTATGQVYGGKDSYRFDGEITAFSLDGPAIIKINGQQVDPAELGDSQLPTILSINGHEEKVSYEFTVSGDLEKSTANGASIDDNDVIDGNTASGFVNGGTDSYRFSGTITDFDADGDVTVRVDGEPLDRSQFGAAPTIEQYEVLEAGSANPHANILVHWDVADADGDLASVTVDVLDRNGTAVASATTSVSGEAAYDVNYFEIENVNGQSFDIRTTVTDAAGNESSATKTVQE